MGPTCPHRGSASHGRWGLDQSCRLRERRRGEGSPWAERRPDGRPQRVAGEDHHLLPHVSLGPPLRLRPGVLDWLCPAGVTRPRGLPSCAHVQHRPRAREAPGAPTVASARPRTCSTAPAPRTLGPRPGVAYLSRRGPPGTLVRPRPGPQQRARTAFRSAPRPTRPGELWAASREARAGGPPGGSPEGRG